MNSNFFLLLLIVFFTTSFMSIVGCNNHKIIKETSSRSVLQEQCVNRSKEYFKNEYGNGMINGENGERLISKYTNHYNKKLNQCYILITSTQLIRNTENKIENIGLKTLFELNENKKYGSLIKYENNNEIINCRILEKYCNLEKEWNLVIKPYMEE
jgi:sensor histidine kinase regulating citrate/malate metabolism